MLVLVPTREDVLAVHSIDEAFDLWTRKPTRREVALIRTAEAEGMIWYTPHAADAADDESIPEEVVWHTVRRGDAKSKDVDDSAGRAIGINFESARIVQPIRAKVSWRVRYFIATVHTV